MDEDIVVIMLRDAETGFLEKELATCRVNMEDSAYLVNMIAERDGEGETYAVRMKVTTERDVLDWEFDAIYDYYDSEIFGVQDAVCTEVEDCENPMWELSFAWNGDEAALETMADALLAAHVGELASVYEEIAAHEDEYTNDGK